MSASITTTLVLAPATRFPEAGSSAVTRKVNPELRSWFSGIPTSSGAGIYSPEGGRCCSTHKAISVHWSAASIAPVKVPNVQPGINQPLGLGKRTLLVSAMVAGTRAQSSEKVMVTDLDAVRAVVHWY